MTLGWNPQNYEPKWLFPVGHGCTTCNLSSWEERQEEQEEHRVILSCTVDLRLAWATWNPVWKIKQTGKNLSCSSVVFLGVLSEQWGVDQQSQDHTIGLWHIAYSQVLIAHFILLLFPWIEIDCGLCKSGLNPLWSSKKVAYFSIELFHIFHRDS